MKKIFKRGMSGLLAVLMAFTVLAGFGTTTAFAASETAESYMISFPRDGDAAQIYSEDAWGHSAKNYMNGWATGSSNYTIDRAILASTTEREFLRVMKEMGYEVITKTPKGSPRVHPIVRIVDGGKNFRLDKLGEYYELDSIKQRIQNNYRRKTPFPEVAEDTKAPYYQYKEKAKKASGLYALYLYYCYELHIIVHKPASVKKVSAFLREDVTKLDRYIAQADFLAKTGLETVETLAGYKAEKEKQVEALTQQRTGLKNELKRYLRKEDFQSAEATRARIAELTTELKTCRKEIALCSDIADRSEQVRKNLEQIEQQKIERKERTENELLVRRSSRAGREDDAQRR